MQRLNIAKSDVRASVEVQVAGDLYDLASLLFGYFGTPSGAKADEDGFVPRFLQESKKQKRKRKKDTPVFYAILVAAHLYFTRCASER